MSAHVAGAARSEGDRVYAALLDCGADLQTAAAAAADAAADERYFATLDFYGAQRPEDV